MLKVLLLALLSRPAAATPETPNTVMLAAPSGPPIYQCGTPTCWAHAWINYVNAHASAVHREPMVFSIDFLLYQDLRSRALDMWRKGEGKLNGGGSAQRALALSLEHGLMPAEIWTPKQPLVRAYAVLTERIKPLFHDLDRSPWSAIRRDDFVSQLDKILAEELGTPPERFVWRGNLTTPEALATEILGLGSLREHRLRANTAIWTGESTGADEAIISRYGNTVLVRERSRQSTSTDPYLGEDLIRSRIRAGRPLLLTYYTRDASGAPTLKVSSGNPPLVRAALTESRSYSRAHMVLLVGFTQDGVIAKNSQGDGSEFRTPFRLLDRYFLRFHGAHIIELDSGCVGALRGSPAAERPEHERHEDDSGPGDQSEEGKHPAVTE